MDPTLAIIAVSEAVKAICQLTEVLTKNMTEEQKKVQSEIFVEMAKPLLETLKFFNKVFEKQLDK